MFEWMGWVWLISTGTYATNKSVEYCIVTLIVLDYSCTARMYTIAIEHSNTHTHMFLCFVLCSAHPGLHFGGDALAQLKESSILNYLSFASGYCEPKHSARHSAQTVDSAYSCTWPGVKRQPRKARWCYWSWPSLLLCSFLITWTLGAGKTKQKFPLIPNSRRNDNTGCSSISAHRCECTLIFWLA